LNDSQNPDERQFGDLKRKLHTAQMHDIMYFKMHDQKYRHTVSRRFAAGESTSGESGYLQIALDRQGHIEKIHVELDSGRPIVDDHTQFCDLIASSMFQDGFPASKLAQLIHHSWSDDRILIYVIEWIRREVKIVRDSNKVLIE
jgi:hypothetical protein